MRETVGNMWDFSGWKVVPTNLGWKRDGTAIMGAGVARRVADRYPSLPVWYGRRCQKYRDRTAVAPFPEGQLILFPTKPLNEASPHLSWNSNADLALIQRSAKQLVALYDLLHKKFGILRVVLPLVGCGHGNLKPVHVIPLLRRILVDDHYLLVISPD